jgi:hypothetical protein
VGQANESEGVMCDEYEFVDNDSGFPPGFLDPYEVVRPRPGPSPVLPLEYLARTRQSLAPAARDLTPAERDEADQYLEAVRDRALLEAEERDRAAQQLAELKDMCTALSARVEKLTRVNKALVDACEQTWAWYMTECGEGPMDGDLPLLRPAIALARGKEGGPIVDRADGAGDS